MAARQPQLGPGAALGRDRREGHAQILYPAIADMLFELRAQLFTIEDGAAAERQVHQAEQALLAGERARETLDGVEPIRSETAADDGADGCSGDDVGRQAVVRQFAQDADMRPSARRARSERQTDHGPALSAAIALGEAASAAAFARLLIKPTRERQHRTHP